MLSLLQCIFNGGTTTQIVPSPWGSQALIKYVVPWVHLSLHPKLHVDRVSQFSAAHQKVCLYFTMGQDMPPQKKLPHPMGESIWWLSTRVVSVLDSGTVGPGFKSQQRRCRVTV